MAARPRRTPGLLKYAKLTRRQLIVFALASAALNGVMTASVGSWLAQSYASFQGRRTSVEAISSLIYERRTRAGMVASALRRKADIDEVRHRKQAYDEAYVEWNSKVWQSIFAVREAAQQVDISFLEDVLQTRLVAAMADVDRCITKAYDERVAGADPLPTLDACRVTGTQTFVLDCAGTLTDELFKLTRLSFVPFVSSDGDRKVAEAKVEKACTRPAAPPPSAAPPPVAAAPIEASPIATGAAPVSAPPAPK